MALRNCRGIVFMEVTTPLNKPAEAQPKVIVSLDSGVEGRTSNTA